MIITITNVHLSVSMSSWCLVREQMLTAWSIQSRLAMSNSQERLGQMPCLVATAGNECLLRHCHITWHLNLHAKELDGPTSYEENGLTS